MDGGDAVVLENRTEGNAKSVPQSRRSPTFERREADERSMIELGVIGIGTWAWGDEKWGYGRGDAGAKHGQGHDL